MKSGNSSRLSEICSCHFSDGGPYDQRVIAVKAIFTVKWGSTSFTGTSFVPCSILFKKMVGLVSPEFPPCSHIGR